MLLMTSSSSACLPAGKVIQLFRRIDKIKINANMYSDFDSFIIFIISSHSLKLCLLLVCFLKESLVLDTNPHMSHVKPPVLRCLASTCVLALQAKLKVWLQAAQENPPSTGSIMLLMADFKSEQKQH